MKKAHLERFEAFMLRVKRGVLPLEQQTETWNYYNRILTLNQLKVFRLVTQIEFKDLRVLDIGFGLGDALETFISEGAIASGIALNQKDIDAGNEKGWEVYLMDQSFTDFHSETFDIIWSRHCLEHSFMPSYTLYEYNRIMKQNAYLYVEVPAPETKMNHQNNLEHFSVFTKNCWLSLMKRSGFKIVSCSDMDLNIISKEKGKDLYYSFILQKEEKNDN